MRDGGTGVTVAVPCHNEVEGVEELRARLWPAVEAVRRVRPVEVLLIDDGSTDGTAAALERAFAGLPGVRLVRHPVNRNLGGVLATGAAEARQPWLAWLDADCTYDPAILEPLTAALEAGADLATASPYHPDGRVAGVPPHRLLLSRACSRAYRVLVGPRVHTFTALVRAYRVSVAPAIASDEHGFAAVADMMLRALVQGLRVVEVPAVLETRRTGESKMRLVRVIRAHVRLMVRLAADRRSFAELRGGGVRRRGGVRA